jgi:hypothetical protein
MSRLTIWKCQPTLGGQGGERCKKSFFAFGTESECSGLSDGKICFLLKDAGCSRSLPRYFAC